jgi:hypothetical protein
MIVPDIKNGITHNGEERDNRWQSFIESCLIKTENGSDKHAFLATPCRGEHVSSQSIFSPDYYEYAVAYTWDGPIQIKTGAGLHHSFLKRIRSYGPARNNGSVETRNVSVKRHDFDNILAVLQSQETKDNFIYMQVEWTANGCSYKLICPCRYINFSHVKNDKPYIQPISGNVLVEIDNRFYLAYVSVHVTEHGTERTELNLKEHVSLFNLKRYPLTPLKYPGLFRRNIIPFLLLTYLRLVTLPFSNFFNTDEFCRVISFDAGGTFLHPLRKIGTVRS